MSKYLSDFFMYARPIQVQTKVHFNILLFLVVRCDMFFKLCCRRCQNGTGLFSLFKQFLEESTNHC